MILRRKGFMNRKYLARDREQSNNAIEPTVSPTPGPRLDKLYIVESKD